MLLHSLWQAGAVGTLLWLMLRRMPAHRAQGRYAVAVAALFVVVLGAVTTLTVLSNPSPDSVPTERAAAPVAPDANSRADLPNTTKLPESRFAPTPPSHSPLVGAPSAGKAAARINTPGWEAAVVWLWLAGVLIMLIRMAGALRGASRLAAQAEICTSGCVCDMAKSLGRSLGLIRRVAVRVHPHLRVPAVVGLVRPVILLPLSAMSGLSPQQLEAVLLHELAHIRRHDLLVQIGQMLIEAMLFFNPAVWWISRQVRIEREACADFAAARLLGRPDRYVQALADWAQRLSSHGQAGEVAGITSASLAMADPKREHSLLERAHRLLVADYRPRLKLPWHTLAGLLLFGALLIGGLWQGANLAVRAGCEGVLAARTHRGHRTGSSDPWRTDAGENRSLRSRRHGYYFGHDSYNRRIARAEGSANRSIRHMEEKWQLGYGRLQLRTPGRAVFIHALPGGGQILPLCE
jgi:beta-lactamase regulating signal transducer with metallopeptidase domain